MDNRFLKCGGHSCSSSFLKVAMLKLSNSLENLQLVGLDLDTTKYASQILVLVLTTMSCRNGAGLLSHNLALHDVIIGCGSH